MLYPLILLLHIGAACITIGLAAYALYVLWQGKSASYRTSALTLGFVAAFQVFSGTVLAVLSPELSAVYLSTHIAAYIGACMFIEALLFVRMSIRQAQDKQNIALTFPTKLAASPVLASLVLFVGAFAAGL